MRMADDKKQLAQIEAEIIFGNLFYKKTQFTMDSFRIRRDMT